MALSEISVRLVPLTMALAKEFRDMKSVKREREIGEDRLKNLAKLLEQGMFFTPEWGKCQLDGEVYRVNGNHTSHMLTACFQAHNGGLDEKSQWLFDTILSKKGGGWHCTSPDDLPQVDEGFVKVRVDHFKAETRKDLMDAYARYDSKKSARTTAHLLNIHIGEHEDLDEYGDRDIASILGGIQRAARLNPTGFGMTDKDEVIRRFKGIRGPALEVSEIRRAVAWVINTVPMRALYSKVAGAQVFVEVWAKHGEEEATRMVEVLWEMIEANGEKDPAVKWSNELTRRVNKPTLAKLVNGGRAAFNAVTTRMKGKDAQQKTNREVPV